MRSLSQRRRRRNAFYLESSDGKRCQKIGKENASKSSNCKREATNGRKGTERFGTEIPQKEEGQMKQFEKMVIVFFLCEQSASK